jgi:hypothetical protein
MSETVGLESKYGPSREKCNGINILNKKGFFGYGSRAATARAL